MQGCYFATMTTEHLDDSPVIVMLHDSFREPRPEVQTAVKHLPSVSISVQGQLQKQLAAMNSLRGREVRLQTPDTENVEVFWLGWSYTVTSSVSAFWLVDSELTACDCHIPSGVITVTACTVHPCDMSNMQPDTFNSRTTSTWHDVTCQTARHLCHLWPPSVIGWQDVWKCDYLFLTVTSLHFCGCQREDGALWVIYSHRLIGFIYLKKRSSAQTTL